MRRYIFILIAAAALVGGGGFWLLRAAPATPPPIAAPTATPNIVTVGTSTPVLFTVSIPEPTLNSASVNLLRVDADGSSTVVAQMRDNGQNGDETPGDKVFTAVLTLTEAEPTPFGFQVSAAFRGILRRSLSPKLQFAALAPTSVAVSLPPDPGEHGKTAIAGIDSDGDGMRDDVFRAIVFAVPESERAREAMKQASKAFQPYLLATSGVDAKSANELIKRANACLYFLDASTASQKIGLVKAFVVNTEQRLRAYLAASKSRGTSAGSDYDAPCDFNPDAMRN